MGKYILEQRWCRCGCGASWKCLPESKSEYAMRSHAGKMENPWVVERGQFRRQINQWLDAKCGPPPEEEAYDSILEEIRD